MTGQPRSVEQINASLDRLEQGFNEPIEAQLLTTIPELSRTVTTFQQTTKPTIADEPKHSLKMGNLSTPT